MAGVGRGARDVAPATQYEELAGAASPVVHEFFVDGRDISSRLRAEVTDVVAAELLDVGRDAAQRLAAELRDKLAVGGPISTSHRAEPAGSHPDIRRPVRGVDPEEGAAEPAGPSRTDPEPAAEQPDTEQSVPDSAREPEP